MKIKTSEATEQQLNWLVAKCEGFRVELDHQYTEDHRFNGWWQCGPNHWQPLCGYSTDWAQGGPIIEREKIDLYQSTGRNAAAIWENLPGGGRLIAESKDTPTILTAAMRCYVASKLGEEVEIPDELIGE